jgi:PAS domain S-box-containing protein
MGVKNSRSTGDLTGGEDLTEHKHLEALVRERTAQVRKLSRAVEQSPGTVVITDLRGNIEYANPSFARLTGYSLEEVKGRNPRFLKSGQHPPEFYRDLWKTVLAGEEWHGEFVNRRKNGDLYWESASIAAVRDQHGKITRFVKVAEDITERKRAEEALQRRVEELATLHHIAQTVASVTDLPAALKSVAQTVTGVLDATATMIGGLEGDQVMVLAWYADESGAPIMVGQGFPLAQEMPAVRQALERGETLVVPYVQVKLLSSIYQEHTQARNIEAVMIVPLRARDTLIGLMAVGSGQADRVFTAAQISLAETIAGDIAAAIENARLLGRAQALAVDAERQRLARDLHDAVTQTIYSASLIAEALPRIWERNPVEAKRNLVKLRQLTRGALAEMRTLLFELRPAALEEAELGTLLQQLGDAMTGRTRIPVDVTVDTAGPELPPDVKIVLYRIAQEAFNNVTKHAGATQVTVTLQGEPHRVILAIRDDGRGFDPSAVPGERMGLDIMRERAKHIDAQLNARSVPGQGTEIAVIWSNPKGQKGTSG